MVADPVPEQRSYSVTVTEEPDGGFLAVCEELDIERRGATADEAVDAVAAAIPALLGSPAHR